MAFILTWPHMLFKTPCAPYHNAAIGGAIRSTLNANFLKSIHKVLLCFSEMSWISTMYIYRSGRSKRHAVKAEKPYFRTAILITALGGHGRLLEVLSTMLHYYVVDIKYRLPVSRNFLLDCLGEVYWNGSNSSVVLHSLFPGVICVLAASG